MANVKSVNIIGTAPFNITYEGSECLIRMLAFLAGPVSGIRLTWTPEAVEMKPNAHGGKTAIYGFTLTGREAVSWGWIDTFKREIVAAGGTISAATTRDVEGS